MASGRKPHRTIAGRVERLALLGLVVLLFSPGSISRIDGGEERESVLQPPRSDEASHDEPPLRSRDLRHWSFRPLRRPALPVVERSDWARNPVDLFVLARLEAAGLAPAPEASRRVLVRRLHLDLTGLPPTPEAVEAFVHDPAPDAHERLVDRLLASPDHAHHRATMWLDLARFAETDGFEHDNLRPTAWQYRDWLIEALATDRPFDELVAAQIAGDLLDEDAGVARDALATGFALAGPDMPDINLRAERRHMVLNEMTATVGSVFLGLPLGCAQCHDHKTDPISQADFYRMRSFFDGVELFRRHPFASDENREKHRRALQMWEEEVAALEAKIQNFETTPRPEPGSSPDAKVEEARAEKIASMRKRLEGLRKKRPAMPTARVLRERPGVAVESRRMERGEFSRPGPAVLAAVPRIIEGGRGTLSPTEARRRLILARELTRPDHPLVYRVMVNRIWARHFGRGLVATPGDFGRTGSPPTHPALLDWLSTELPRQAGSLRAIHRLLVTSSTYRQVSLRPEESEEAAEWTERLERDPDGRLLSRFPRRRLEAEAIRDSLLHVSGQLVMEQGGPGVMPPLPEEIRKSIRRDHWRPDPDPAQHRRKSIYLFVRRNLRFPFLEVFDRPDAQSSCSRRMPTTTAPQSLTLLNSQLSLESARWLSGRVLAETAGRTDRDRLEVLFRRTLSRSPTPRELEVCEEFLAATEREAREDPRAPADLTLPHPRPGDLDPARATAWVALSLSVLNLNEFIYLD